MGHKTGETRTFKDGVYNSTVRENGSVYIETDLLNKKTIAEKLGITKCPWKCKEDLIDGGFVVVDGNDTDICLVDYDNISMSPARDIDKFNAQLIATAPEMLEALIDTMVSFDKLFDKIPDGSNVEYGELVLIKEMSTAYDRFKPIIQKATNKSWEEIKELLK